jgi:molecular chaperone DnaK
MLRTTIDFGIDLGTTNSSIAVFEKQGPRLIRNNDGWQYTPSVVWMDRNGALRVGLAAKDRIVNDPDNCATEFKLWMGKTQSKRFARNNQLLSAEQLSAEVLKSLKQDVQRDVLGEDVEAAVITVPAAFNQPASEATRKAAGIAGIKVSPLLQEPVAAALAYGFQNESENVFWLVYDIGGGTFDAAVLHVREGLIQVVNHGGDNDLGGKLIDWGIVERLLSPTLQQGFNLPQFRRDNPKWCGAFAKLKIHAEKAKIALSKDTSFEIAQEFICVDDSGTPVQLDINISREQVEGIFAPIVAKSIHIARRVLSEKKLSPGNIERVLLVGGPTYTPYLRQVLKDVKEGLGIPLEFSIDPLTVVAQGAALFAGSQRLGAPLPHAKTGEFVLDLEYKAIGAETEPLIGGKVRTSGLQDFTGYCVRFVNSDARPPWRSGNIPLQPNGSFMATLWAQKGGQNTFQIELIDPSGKSCSISPNSLTYTVGLVITDPPLTHNIGIAMADNKVDVLFKKGSPLPAKAKTVHKTVLTIHRGTSGEEVKIPFIEGNHVDADLNRKIGHLVISAAKVNRDLPLGSEVEIKLEIDRSRLLKGSIYVPILDQDFAITLDGLVEPQPDVIDMQRQFLHEKQRLSDLQQLAQTAPTNSNLVEGLNEIREEDALNAVERLLATGNDPEGARTCEKELLDLKAAIRKCEAEAELPKLLAEAADEIKWTGAAAEEHGDENDKKQFSLLLPELEAAMRGTADVLRRKIEEMYRLRIHILMRKPEYWVGYRDYLAERQSEMTDQDQARIWLSHAERAIQAGDLQALRSACNQLWALLPKAVQESGYGGTTVRVRSA